MSGQKIIDRLEEAAKHAKMSSIAYSSFGIACDNDSEERFIVIQGNGLVNTEAMEIYHRFIGELIEYCKKKNESMVRKFVYKVEPSIWEEVGRAKIEAKPKEFKRRARKAVAK